MTKLSLLPTPRDPEDRGLQTSRPNPLPKAIAGGRGRSRVAIRRAHGWGPCDPRTARAALPWQWQDFVTSNFASREECAVFFGVTFQTACNWFDGLVAPSSPALMCARRDMRIAFDAWADAVEASLCA